MKVKILTFFIGALFIISCSKEEESCECNQYLKSSNGSLTLFGGASMQFCDGTLANPNPNFMVYRKDCE